MTLTQVLHPHSLVQTKWHLLANAAHHTKINILVIAKLYLATLNVSYVLWINPFLALPKSKSCKLRLNFYNLWLYCSKYKKSRVPHLYASINSHTLWVKILAPISTKLSLFVNKTHIIFLEVQRVAINIPFQIQIDTSRLIHLILVWTPKKFQESKSPILQDYHLILDIKIC